MTTNTAESRPSVSPWILATGACSVVTLIASFMPWAHAGPYEVSGINNDGQITLFLSAVAVLMAIWGSGLTGIRNWPAVSLGIMVACMAIIAAIGVADVSNVQDISIPGLDRLFDVGVSIGLWLILIAGIVGTITGLVALVAWVRGRDQSPG